MARPGLNASENFGDLFDARFNKIFDEEFKQRDQSELIAKLFDMRTSTRNYEKMGGVGALGDIGEFDGSIFISKS